MDSANNNFFLWIGTPCSLVSSYNVSEEHITSIFSVEVTYAKSNTCYPICIRNQKPVKDMMLLLQHWYASHGHGISQYDPRSNFRNENWKYYYLQTIQIT
jgi:hypothetical protein